MKQYTYRDHRRPEGEKIVFICSGKDILEADEKFFDSFAQRPIGLPFLSVSISNREEE